MTNTPHDYDQGEADALADVIDSVPHPDDDFSSSHVAPAKKKMALPQKAMLGVGGIALVLMAGYAYTNMKAPVVMKPHPKPMFSQSQGVLGETSPATMETPKLPAGMNPPPGPLGPDAKKLDAAAPVSPKSAVILDNIQTSDASKQTPAKTPLPLAPSDVKPTSSAAASLAQLDPFAPSAKAADPFAAPVKSADPYTAKTQPVVTPDPVKTMPNVTVKPVAAATPSTTAHHKVVKKSRKIEAKAKRVIVSTPPEENGYERLF